MFGRKATPIKNAQKTKDVVQKIEGGKTVASATANRDSDIVVDGSNLSEAEVYAIIDALDANTNK